MNSEINHDVYNSSMTNYFGQSSQKAYYPVYCSNLVEKLKELDLMIGLGPELNAEDVKLMNRLLCITLDRLSKKESN